MLEHIKAYWPYILPLLTGVVGWLASKESRGLQNASKILDMYDQITDQIKAQLKDSDDVIKALKDTIRLMRGERDSCKETLIALEKDHDKLQRLYVSQVQQNEKTQADLNLVREMINQSKINN